jgi:hypothetical protein
MARKPKVEPTERTPKGYEVPVRSRAAVLSDFRKVAAPPKAPRDRKKPKPA